MCLAICRLYQKCGHVRYNKLMCDFIGSEYLCKPNSCLRWHLFEKDCPQCLRWAPLVEPSPREETARAAAVARTWGTDGIHEWLAYCPPPVESPPSLLLDSDDEDASASEDDEGDEEEKGWRYENCSLSRAASGQSWNSDASTLCEPVVEENSLVELPHFPHAEEDHCSLECTASTQSRSSDKALYRSEASGKCSLAEGYHDQRHSKLAETSRSDTH